MTSTDTKSHLKVCARWWELVFLRGRLSATALICESSLLDLWLCLWTFFFLTLSSSTVSTPRPSEGRLKARHRQGNRKEEASAEFKLSLMSVAACNFRNGTGTSFWSWNSTIKQRGDSFLIDGDVDTCNRNDTASHPLSVQNRKSSPGV